MIDANGLAKRFGTIHAVNGVSFSARDGEVFGLLGPNGAGKTTTMRLLAAVLEPDSGTAEIDGRDLRRDPAAVRAVVGTLPEFWGLYGRLTPRENLRYFGKLHGMRGRVLEDRLSLILEWLGLSDCADRKCDPFSKGMKQKVALGRALIHDPHTLLLDEPTAGLDVMSARRVRELITRLRSEGRCVLLSTHLLDEAERLCDRIAVIHRGRIVAEGSPVELTRLSGKANLEDAFVELVDGEPVEEAAG